MNDKETKRPTECISRVVKERFNKEELKKVAEKRDIKYHSPYAKAAKEFCEENGQELLKALSMLEGNLNEKIYPNFKHGDYDSPRYYVEFNRGGQDWEFTIFLRSFIIDKDEWEKLKRKDPNDFAVVCGSNEGHPWNIFTAEYGKDGCIPDKSWVKWMIDALNEKLDRETNKL